MRRRQVRCLDCRELVDWVWDRMCYWCRGRYERALCGGENWALSRAATLAHYRPRERHRRHVQLTLPFPE